MMLLPLFCVPRDTVIYAQISGNLYLLMQHPWKLFHHSSWSFLNGFAAEMIRWLFRILFHSQRFLRNFYHGLPSRCHRWRYRATWQCASLAFRRTMTGWARSFPIMPSASFGSPTKMRRRSCVLCDAPLMTEWIRMVGVCCMYCCKTATTKRRSASSWPSASTPTSRRILSTGRLTTRPSTEGRHAHGRSHHAAPM